MCTPAVIDVANQQCRGPCVLLRAREEEFMKGMSTKVDLREGERNGTGIVGESYSCGCGHGLRATIT